MVGFVLLLNAAATLGGDPVDVLLSGLSAAATLGGDSIDVKLITCDSSATAWARASPPNIPANSSLVVRGTSQCLNVEAWRTAPGSHVWTTACKTEEAPHVLNRVWLMQANGTLLNPASELCLDGAKGAASAAGDRLQLRDCGAADASKWAFNEGSGQLSAPFTGLCIALDGQLAPTPAPTPAPAPAPRERTVVTLGGAEPRARSARGYSSFNMDWHANSEEPPAWINMSVQLLPLGAPGSLLDRAAAALAPAVLRVGGSEGDVVAYDVPSHGSTCADMNVTDPQFCLGMPRWEQITAFAARNGLRLVFGLNAISGRAHHSQEAPLDLANIDALLAYTAEKKLAVHGWELGNERPHIPPHVMAADFKNLAARVAVHWPDDAGGARPLVIGNDCNSNPGYLNEFLPLVAGVLDVVTYHHYDGYGGDAKLASEIMTKSFLDKTRQPAIKAAFDAHMPAGTELWVGEAAAAWRSGRRHVTDAFTSSFWYADALAGDAADNHTAYCRQTLVGGDYGLLNRTNFSPNPDYYVAALHGMTMGDSVLDATSLPGATAPNDTLRVYAHCAAAGAAGAAAGAAGGAAGDGVTVLLINFDAKSSYTVTALQATLGDGSPVALPLAPRHEYVLSAASLDSQAVLLNGAPLALVGADQQLPQLKPHTVSSGGAIKMEPHTIGYFVIPGAAVPACASVV